ncbi:MAG: energy transducer TonB [Ramlibacter sp.]|nr:energy transducer TonB [Ramlibacter sp.]
MSTSTHTIPLHHQKFGAKDPTRKMIGWAAVILIHAFVLWALVTGTARKGLEIIKKPLEAAVIQEVIIPPPPPPPPKVIEPPKPQVPKVEAPPPPFVPPPEVTPPTTSAPSIASVATPPATPAVIAPPPPPAAPTGRQEMGVACPTQVRPEMPRQAIKEGAEGVVKAQATIRDGAVREVSILSGPRVFHNAVRNAMMQYKCISGGGDIIATQEFNFKIE